LSGVDEAGPKLAYVRPATENESFIDKLLVSSITAILPPSSYVTFEALIFAHGVPTKFAQIKVSAPSNKNVVVVGILTLT
jgi:hypothetical protein